MLTTKPLDIRADHAEIIHKILKDNLEEGTYVFAFGSRANWTAKQSSDLDLAIDGFRVKLDKKIKSNLEDAFEESDLPYKVDAVDLNSVSESFREAIQDQLVRVLWDWKKYCLNDVIKIIGGGTPRRSNPEYWNGEIPWLSVVDFNNNSKYVFKTSESITELGLQESSTRLLEKWQIIISARGTVGCLAQLKRQMAFNQSCYGIDSDVQYTINDYLYYLLKEKNSELRTKAHGAVFDTITKETFKTIYITLPPLPEQKRIAEILSSLDNKIEINKQINQTLEEMAETLFKSWFINFDPVRVKKAALEAGAGEKEANLAVMKFISSKTDEELEKFRDDYPEKWRELEDVAKLFPAEFQNSELGEVPFGWRVGKLGEVVNICGGGTPPTGNPEFWNGEIHWTSPKDLSLNKGLFLFDTEKKITDKGLKKISSGLLPIDTLLLSSRAPIGYLAISKIQVAINQGYIAFFPDGYLSNFFMYLWLKYNMSLVIASANGSTFLEISKKSFKEIKIVIADTKNLENFDKVIKPIFIKIRDNSEQIQSLNRSRDELLPRLMRGELCG